MYTALDHRIPGMVAAMRKLNQMLKDAQDAVPVAEETN